MAKNKNSFILYADLLATVSKLPDNKAGKLFKTILEYVNDKNPEPEDILVQVAFEPIKQQLKRDLKEWEEERNNRSEAGKKGMLKRWGPTKSITENNTVISPITKITDNVTVTDTVNVTVTERERPPKDFYDLEADRRRPLTECLGIAIRDEGWVRRNKTNQRELEIFNDYLERTGDTLKTFLDYKKHFSNFKAKYPDKLKSELTIEELRQMAKEIDKQKT